jgi:hypothetical protein
MTCSEHGQISVYTGRFERDEEQVGSSRPSVSMRPALHADAHAEHPAKPSAAMRSQPHRSHAYWMT